MDIKQLTKPLQADEIDFRIQSINKVGYATILAYKDARADMKRLDEVFTPFGWQKKYDLINGNLFCSVGIYNTETKEWIWKQDVGTESMTEKEKGQASDAFKRACFNFGIGRELYEYPIIQVKLKSDEFELKDGRVKQTWNLKLRDWTWTSEFNEEGELISLRAVDNNLDVRYTYPEETKREAPKTIKKEEPKEKAKSQMTDVLFTKVLARINDGDKTALDNAKKYYEILPKYMITLESALKNQK